MLSQTPKLHYKIGQICGKRIGQRAVSVYDGNVGVLYDRVGERKIALLNEQSVAASIYHQVENEPATQRHILPTGGGGNGPPCGWGEKEERIRRIRAVKGGGRFAC